MAQFKCKCPGLLEESQCVMLFALYEIKLRKGLAECLLHVVQSMYTCCILICSVYVHVYICVDCPHMDMSWTIVYT